MQGSHQQGDESEEGILFRDVPFLVTAAHELKSPLALMRQLALSLETDTLSDAERTRVIRQITLTSERALRLTTDLSRSSRLEDSLFDLEPLNPQQLCEDVARELMPLYRANGREIRVLSSPRRAVLAVANRELLQRIMLNFGDNALHYADSQAPVELRASTYDHGAKIRLGVRDHGPGVPSDMWQRLQAQLGKDALPLHMRPQSSGLGLYIAGQFARAMHGTIGVTRHRDGATFYVDIDASSQLKLL